VLLENVRAGFPAIDLHEARELRMVNPRYAGLDRYNRPYAVTAAIGRQVPDRNDVMALERPQAVMIAHRGASVLVTAATGVYQSQAQLLDLFEDVNLVPPRWHPVRDAAAHLNVSENTAEGHEPVEGHGPSGDIAGEGFLILSKGDTIIFTGQSSLLLRGAKQDAPAIAPPGLPAGIEKAAAQSKPTPGLYLWLCRSRSILQAFSGSRPTGLPPPRNPGPSGGTSQESRQHHTLSAETEA